MSYIRVIPRDLFNEASLLKCLGKLALHLESIRSIAVLEDFGQAFSVVQDENDGTISVENLPFMIGHEVVRLYRPLNSREPYPLYAQLGDEEIQVFDDAGDLSPQFLGAIEL